MDVSPAVARIAEALWDEFGSTAVAHAYEGETPLHVFDSRVSGGEIAYLSTMGLCGYDFGMAVDDGPLRVELLHVPLAENADKALDFLASCAASIIGNRVLVQPDILLPDMTALLWPGSAMRHALLLDPFSADLPPLALPEMTVAWLEIAPVSESERAFAEVEGVEALKARFAEQGVEFSDLDRASAV